MNRRSFFGSLIALPAVIAGFADHRAYGNPVGFSAKNAWLEIEEVEKRVCKTLEANLKTAPDLISARILKQHQEFQKQARMLLDLENGFKRLGYLDDYT